MSVRFASEAERLCFSLVDTDSKNCKRIIGDCTHVSKGAVRMLKAARDSNFVSSTLRLCCIRRRENALAQSNLRPRSSYPDSLVTQVPPKKRQLDASWNGRDRMSHSHYQSIFMKAYFELLFKTLVTKPGRRQIAAGSCT